MVENKIHIENVGNPKVNQTVTQNSSQSVDQKQSLDFLDQLKDMQGLFCNLKEDILDEADIEIEDEKEKKRIQNELGKAEKALTEAESAAKEGNELDAAAKNRLETFFNSLADKNSRLGKALEFVGNGANKAQELAQAYNKFATNIGWPAVPPLLLGKDKQDTGQ